MKTISIISVGNELLNGRCSDTNNPWLCERVRQAGLSVLRTLVLPDSAGDIAFFLQNLNTHYILITGGLGPTLDDVTRDAIAACTEPLILFEDQLEIIQSYFTGRGRPFPKSNIVQAMLPAKATAIPNHNGTAPGIHTAIGDSELFALPGVPSEMEAMFDEYVLPRIRHADIRKEAVLKLTGIGESALADMLGDMMARGADPEINCTASNSLLTLRIYSADSGRLDAALNRLEGLFGECIYSRSEETLQQVVVKLLIERRASVSTAESCTGGMIAAMITDVPGASASFTHGWVTYSNQAKRDIGVSDDALENYGAVSAEVVSQMAASAMERSGSDFAVAVSGIAGPSGGTEQKPVGTVYICVKSKNSERVEKCFYPGERDYFRMRVSIMALDMLRRDLLEAGV
ncbi:MAG: CinA family nicotinamide mononucleotide deamidase-related protein [Phycisphaerae bacterium]|jgi:nicotinamide-nucleotide amidase